VLANRVASEGHAAMLEESLRDPAQWEGALMRSPAFNLPERHLGLVMSAEMNDAMARLDAAADALAATPLGQMNAQRLQAWSVDFAAPVPTPPEVPDLLRGLTIAVARDAGFCFIYAANLDCLRAMGARLVFFSPLADGSLPECDALWLPGGYPELHGRALADNSPMKTAIAAHVAAGKPLWAECGGMMALFEALHTADNGSFPMWGVLPGRVTVHKRIAALGPQRLAVPGGSLRGHTFHYSTCDTPLEAAARTEAAPGRKLRGEGEALYVAGPAGNVKASYFHAWFASNPAGAASLFMKDKP
ncbi:MAG: cobyrinic acid a,c-diamide synthase, partial [Polaromonas sp.]|nr:cobyrinic acid a,c-diamide synthase [Polaromonas sp.]